MNILIMGCGRVGSSLASSFSQKGHTVIILDINSTAFQRLPADFEGTAIVGNGTDQDTLTGANVNDTDVFLALTQGDNRNLMAAQIAKHIFKVPRVLSRVYDKNRADIFAKLGIETFSSTYIMSNMIEDIVINPETNEEKSNL
jgi:trk system potassium uptake protein TrkA